MDFNTPNNLDTALNLDKPYCIKTMKNNTISVRLSMLALLPLLVLMSNGCATSKTKATGGPDPTLFNSEPQGAMVKNNGKFLGYTPFSAQLSPKTKAFDFSAEMPGYQPAFAHDVARMDVSGGGCFILGNTLWTAICPPIGLIGFGTDIVTKDYRSHGKEVFFRMVPLNGGLPQQAFTPAPQQRQPSVSAFVDKQPAIKSDPDCVPEKTPNPLAIRPENSFPTFISN